MCVIMTKLLLLGVISTGAMCNYVFHPFGGYSYFANTNFQPAVGYSYVAPTGQTVNVKLATSALVNPPQPQISATPNNRKSQFVFQSATTPIPLSLDVEIGTESQQQIPSFQFSQSEQPVFNQNPIGSRFSGPPRPESLFAPATGLEPIASDKQIQAYNDYVRDLENENSISTSSPSSTTSSVSSTSSDLNIDPLAELEAFFNIQFGKKI